MSLNFEANPIRHQHRICKRRSLSVKLQRRQKPIEGESDKLKTLKNYFITILLMTAMCSPAFAEDPHRQADIAEKEIKKSVVAIGQTGKKAGKIIGQNFKEFGKQTGKVFKDIARTIRDRAQKDLR